MTQCKEIGLNSLKRKIKLSNIANKGREIFLAHKILRIEEGLRLKPYYDTLGFPTIGYGELLGKKHAPLPDIVWTEDQALLALNKHLEKAVIELSKNKETKDAWEALKDDPDRKAILISMWYQLGIDGLGNFVRTLSNIVKGDFETVAVEMLESLAARQTPKRWKRQAAAMLSGNVVSTYKL
jgi:lysozyme